MADGKAETAWLINTFTVNNILTLGKERLSGRVAVEDIPSGHIFLTTVMEAMSENHEAVISYSKYGSTQDERLTIRPYAVKEYAKRWYIIAHCIERDALRVYGLDRVTSLEVTGRTFAMPKDFDVDSLFATSFGIYLPTSEARTVTFRTSTSEARFLRDLPMHSSQKEISDDGQSVTFSLFVCPDRNLIMEFCKHAGRIEVLTPEDLRRTVADELEKAALIYAQEHR